MDARKTLRLLALCALPLVAPAAMAAMPQPQLGHFTQRDLELSRAESSSLPAPGVEWENNALRGTEFIGGDPENPLPMNDDNDTAHYCRGRTLIIHVFINHTGGTWSVDERATAGAKAAVAKGFYADDSPSQANVTFDNEGTEDYWFYTATLPYNVPNDGTTGTVIADALADIGFADGDGDGTRADEFTLFLQNWNGGWDNVIAAYEVADRTGRAWASYGTATIVLYTDDTGNVWAHEMGHSYGACDEYVEGGQCNGGIDCGNCQSWYLDEVIQNGNCQLVTCPSDVPCMMINNVFDICDYTLNHWGWVDENADGQLDIVKRRVSGDTFTNIWELWHNGWFYWNNVDQGMVVHQQWDSWAVIGLRSPATADYDLTLYGDNNHNYSYTSSSYGGQTIDFVVGDYNHCPLGNDHIRVSRYSGAADNYNLTWESGTGILYPDGVEREGSWQDYNTVRAWDVPLFAGETITFSLDVLTGNLDLGMALFASSGAPYWVGRASAAWLRDAGGIGATENYTYTVPADDVYGLVVFANSVVDGTFSIQIGPTPYALSEETPFNSDYDLRLFNYSPNAFYWSFIGTRPTAGTNVTVKLFQDSEYQTLLEASDSYAAGATEFIAVDYNDSYSTDYLRVIRTAGTDTHKTEWEHDADILTGYYGGAWAAGHVGKVWDVYLESGLDYFFREYHTPAVGGLDTGIYIFASNDGDKYKPRSAYAGAANYRPPEDGGEWFTYAAPAADWYGAYLIVNDESSGNYSLWLGPRFDLAEDGRITRSNQVVHGTCPVTANYWTAFGIRAASGDNAYMYLFSDSDYGVDHMVATSTAASGINFVVADCNHSPIQSYYVQTLRNVGSGNVDIEWEGGTEYLTYQADQIVVRDATWTDLDVVDAWDIYIDGGVVGGRDAEIIVDDQSGVMDLGIALFASSGAAYYAGKSAAVASADAGGVGVDERILHHATRTDWYGLVVYNKNDSGGAYRVIVQDPDAADVFESAAVTALDLRISGVNPFDAQAALEVSVPARGDAALCLFDVNGRLIRELLRGDITPGRRTVVWDGRDAAGSPVAAGVYMARLQACGGEKEVKLIRSR